MSVERNGSEKSFLRTKLKHRLQSDSKCFNGLWNNFSHYARSRTSFIFPLFFGLFFMYFHLVERYYVRETLGCFHQIKKQQNYRLFVSPGKQRNLAICIFNSNEKQIENELDIPFELWKLWCMSETEKCCEFNDAYHRKNIDWNRDVWFVEFGSGLKLQNTLIVL